MEKSSGYFMYVVLCSDQTFYTGYTTDLNRRISQHNQGVGAKYTRMRRPIRLLFAQEYESKALAMSAEALFKRKTRVQKEQFLIRQQVDVTIEKEPVIVYVTKNEEDTTQW